MTREVAVVIEGRLAEILRAYYKAEVDSTNTWPALFKTEGWKRQRKHVDRVLQHWQWAVAREYKDLNYTGFKVLMANGGWGDFYHGKRGTRCILLFKIEEASDA